MLGNVTAGCCGRLKLQASRCANILFYFSKIKTERPRDGGAFREGHFWKTSETFEVNFIRFNIGKPLIMCFFCASWFGVSISRLCAHSDSFSANVRWTKPLGVFENVFERWFDVNSITWLRRLEMKMNASDVAEASSGVKTGRIIVNGPLPTDFSTVTKLSSIVRTLR